MKITSLIQKLFPPKNQVEIAGNKLQCLVDAVKRIDEGAKYNSIGQRKPIPGIRFFECPDCDNKWREKSRDCHSPSCETCECGIDCHPVDYLEVPELSVDKSGNLV